MKIPSSTIINPADFSRTLRRMVLPAGATLDDIAVPANWSHVFAKLRQSDEVIVETEDHAFRAHLYVDEVATGYVRTIPLHIVEFNKKPKTDENVVIPALPNGYKVNFAPRTRWRFFNEDGLEAGRDYKSEYDAAMAAIEHAAKAHGVAPALIETVAA
jgi:hypothetical protein